MYAGKKKPQEPTKPKIPSNRTVPVRAHSSYSGGNPTADPSRRPAGHFVEPSFDNELSRRLAERRDTLQSNNTGHEERRSSVEPSPASTPGSAPSPRFEKPQWQSWPRKSYDASTDARSPSYPPSATSQSSIAAPSSHGRKPSFFGKPLAVPRMGLSRASSESRGTEDNHSERSDRLQSAQFNDEDAQERKIERGPKQFLHSIRDRVKDPRTAFSRNTENVGEIVAHIKGDLLDLTMVTREVARAGKEGLCAGCSKMDFQQFDSNEKSIPTREELEMNFIWPLDRILQNRSWCKFCRLLFRALCPPENDPLQHDAIQSHI
jgi:hypothetical protein